ncbi:DinB family protein [Anditalea andensis]|uniref:DinB-like domain-containing protein n=1 Tax=Anditalea andensis TaxID=1048983 RepID=A0A074L1X0_9BACT|nr:DinB family protein [Anditalea andensis]KEO73873.1 hypothetical protein EL17_10250 [Anditalea andensis]
MNDTVKPKYGEYDPFYEKYVSYSHGKDIIGLIYAQIDELEDILANKSDDWFLIPYQEGKWTPKELIGHVIDTERIFAFRCLSLARGERGTIPGFDENDYVKMAHFNDIPVKELMEDFRVSRLSLRSMIRHFSERDFMRQGTVNGNVMSSRACLAIIIGHFNHHMDVIKERY